MENDRLLQVELQGKKLREQKREDDFQMQVSSDKIRDFERQNELLGVRLQDCEQIIEKFSEETRQLEVLLDRKVREQDVLERENKNLKQELDEYRLKEAKYC